MAGLTNTVRIGFLGAGKMATAWRSGWLAAGLAASERMLAGDPLAQARTDFTAGTKVRTTADNREVVAASDLLVIAVKPQSIRPLLAEIRPAVTARHLIVSIAAGVTLQQLADGLGAEPAGARHAEHAVPRSVPVLRATPRQRRLRQEDIALVDRLLNAVGRTFRLPESLLDAVTGLSGSGPAFVYVMIEALSDGGVRVGLPRDVATTLAAQTCSARPRWCWRPACTPECSRTW